LPCNLAQATGRQVFVGVKDRVNLPICRKSCTLNKTTMASRLRSIIGLCCALVACAVASAGELTPAMQQEIATLLERIETSNCSFGRNGTWHAPADARKHLQMKVDYMVKRNMLGSTEEFIVKAASNSSVSGEAYQIRCGSGAPMASATWLTAELKRIRGTY
jgi:hypothetical protein